MGDTVRIEGRKRPYAPKDSDVVECRDHGIKTTWGALDAMQRLALAEGIDTEDHLPCILAPSPTPSVTQEDSNG